MSNVPPAPRRGLGRRKRASTLENALVGVGIAVLFAALVAALILLGGLVFWLAWNYGVVPIVAAVGGSVGKIGFWTAVAGSLAVSIIKQIVSPSQRVEVKR